MPSMKAGKLWVVLRCRYRDRTSMGYEPSIYANPCQQPAFGDHLSPIK